MKNNNKIVKAIFFILNMLTLPLFILLLWHFTTTSGKASTLILPSISSIGETLGYQLRKGTLLSDIGVSLLRITKGYGLAALFGIIFGVVMGMNFYINRFFILTFTAIRQIPMLAWVPLLVMWYGIGEASKIAVIFLAAFFPILVNTIGGISETDKRLLEVGKMYQLSKYKMFTRIYLPSALPSIFIGLKIGLGVSWMAVVGAEMIAASSGIGFRINDARSLLQYPIVFCGMLGIAVTGVLLDILLTLIKNFCTPWLKKGKS